jgi:eukaryotic-like serine/threonine-protein kinase
MRILLIDRQGPSGDLVSQQVAQAWPGAWVDLHEPHTAGKPGLQFSWERYDAVLIDLHLGEEVSDALAMTESALDWISYWRPIREEVQASGLPFPPVIVLSSRNDERAAVRAIKLGAADYVRRDEQGQKRLIEAMHEALLERAQFQDRELSATARLKAVQGVIEAGGHREALAAFWDDTVTIEFPDSQPAHPAPAPVLLYSSELPRVKGYRVIRLLGEGGTARVWLAEREKDRSTLVLKVLNPDISRSDSFLQRFLREYRVISELDNEHVARIYEAGIADDLVYIAMEYFAHGDLKARCQRPISSLEALRLIAQIARALDAIHSEGIMHRDMKPHNIMFRSSDRVALVDFGLAKQFGEATITATGGMMATPLYMSPEQCLGREQDARSDLYSTGVILYEMLTGKRLYDSDNLAAIAFMHVHADIPRLPPRLAGYQGLMDRLLAKDPNQRFQSARDLFAHIAY